MALLLEKQGMEPTEQGSPSKLDCFAEPTHWEVNQTAVTLLRGVQEIHKEGLQGRCKALRT